jgi:PAS domain S-box-containing protein
VHRHVYELLDRINRTNSLVEIYNAALDSISAALKCDRASILLCDDLGVMRFVAWKGLSDGYRKAVEGHSPWARDNENPQPITIPNISSADLKADLRAVIQAEGIQALAFVPLIYGGKLLGKVMVYFDAPHDFNRDELGLAQAIATEVTFAIQRQGGEEALRESESRKSAILDSAIDCIITIDHESRIIEVNQAFERTFGYKRGEVIGKLMAELIIPERFRQAHYAGLARYVATGQGPILGQRVELSALRRDGTEFPVELGIVAIERDGRPLFTGTLRDITERKRNEGALAQAHAELRRHAAELEDRVRERTASLDESLKSLETLLYTIAHDLRAPNRAMQGYAQLLTQGYAEKLDDEGRFFLDRISRAAIRNERLIRDLLEFGRLVHAEFPCRRLNPEATIAGVVATLESEIKASQATVEVADQWPEVCANDSALGHVLTNLLSNALKYVAPGTRPKVRVFPKILADRVRICVEDNGIGVAPEQHERIFEPFQRAATGKYEGTGMGLAIVRKAAERMGGAAGVESTPGQGSCFWVELLSGTKSP